MNKDTNDAFQYLFLHCNSVPARNEMHRIRSYTDSTMGHEKKDLWKKRTEALGNKLSEYHRIVQNDIKQYSTISFSHGMPYRSYRIYNPRKGFYYLFEAWHGLCLACLTAKRKAFCLRASHKFYFLPEESHRLYIDEVWLYTAHWHAEMYIFNECACILWDKDVCVGVR